MIPSAPPLTENDLPPSYEEFCESVASELHISRPEARTTPPPAPSIDKSIEAEASGFKPTAPYEFSNGINNSPKVSKSAFSSKVDIAPPYTPNLILQTQDDSDPRCGTVCPIRTFNPQMDAEALEIAMRSDPKSRNREAIIKILCHRSTIQRQKIAIEYRKKFSRDLIVQSRIEYLVTEVNYAILHDCDYLSDLLLYLSNDEMIELQKAYVQNHRKTISDSIDEYIIREACRGTIQYTLKLICEGKRDESNSEVNNDLITEDLKPFYTPPGYLPRYDQRNTKISDMFALRNWKYIKKFAVVFEKTYNTPLKKVIKENFAMNLAHLYCGIIDYANNKNFYFAKCLKRSMQGLGTNDRALIRTIVSRCEIDLIPIKREFYSLTSKSLKSWIKDDTSGFYKYTLYELIGEPKNF